MLAIMIGILASRAALYIEGGIVNGGAMSDEPACGGGSVRGSLLGGNVKRDAKGAIICTVGDAIMRFWGLLPIQFEVQILGELLIVSQWIMPWIAKKFSEAEFVHTTTGQGSSHGNKEVAINTLRWNGAK